MCPNYRHFLAWGEPNSNDVSISILPYATELAKLSLLSKIDMMKVVSKCSRSWRKRSRQETKGEVWRRCVLNLGARLDLRYALLQAKTNWRPSYSRPLRFPVQPWIALVRESLIVTSVACERTLALLSLIWNPKVRWIMLWLGRQLALLFHCFLSSFLRTGWASLLPTRLLVDGSVMLVMATPLRWWYGLYFNGP